MTAVKRISKYKQKIQIIKTVTTQRQSLKTCKHMGQIYSDVSRYEFFYLPSLELIFLEFEFLYILSIWKILIHLHLFKFCLQSHGQLNVFPMSFYLYTSSKTTHICVSFEFTLIILFRFDSPVTETSF